MCPWKNISVDKGGIDISWNLCAMKKRIQHIQSQVDRYWANVHETPGAAR
jgi:hypothetical protein